MQASVLLSSTGTHPLVTSENSVIAYRAFKDLFVEGLSFEGLVWLRGLRDLLLRSPVLGGKVRGVGLCQRACLCPWQTHLPYPKQHISTAPDCLRQL